MGPAPVQEILANKLTALLSRAETRDLVDVLLLERSGYSVESALKAALSKDGAGTPATLAWVLSQVEIDDKATLPAGVPAPEAAAFIRDLIRRLRLAAAPSQEPKS